MNCLKCHSLPRVESEQELKEMSVVAKPQPVLRKWKAERTWSGNLVPRPSYKNKTRNEAANATRNGHRRLHSVTIGYDTQPKLVRSCGMRRDWSFEDLKQKRDGQVKEVEGHR